MATEQRRHSAVSTEGWQLLEDSAEAYEVHLVPQFMAHGAQILVELASVGEGDRVLDVATGTGIVARTAAPIVGSTGSICGVDLNTSMLAVARRKSAGLLQGIEWRLGDAQDLPYPDAAFNVVFCQQGLQFVPDRAKALSEMHRVLAPGGRLALSMMRSPRHNPSYPILGEVIARYFGSEAGGIVTSPFAQLGTEDLRGLVTSAGFQDVRIIHGIGPARYSSVEEFARLELASSPLAAAAKAVPDEEWESVIGELDAALSDFVDDQGLIFPTAVYVVVATR